MMKTKTRAIASGFGGSLAVFPGAVTLIGLRTDDFDVAIVAGVLFVLVLGIAAWLDRTGAARLAAATCSASAILAVLGGGHTLLGLGGVAALGVLWWRERGLSPSFPPRSLALLSEMLILGIAGIVGGLIGIVGAGEDEVSSVMIVCGLVLLGAAVSLRVRRRRPEKEAAVGTAVADAPAKEPVPQERPEPVSGKERTEPEPAPAGSSRGSVRGEAWSPGVGEGDAPAHSSPEPKTRRKAGAEDAASIREGEVEGFRERTETVRGQQRYIWSFRLLRFDSQGNRLHPLTVEMSGRSIKGGLREGDRVRLPMDPPARGSVQVSRLENLTDRTAVRAVGASPLEVLVLVIPLALILFWLLALLSKLS